MTHATSTIALQPSRYRRQLAWGLMALLACSVMTWPASTPWPLFLVLLPSFYALRQWRGWQPPLWLTLHPDGQLKWHADSWPTGQLVRSSVICRFGVWLYWQDEAAITHRRWLFCDQVNAADFRLLGRHCQQQRW